MIKNSAVAAVAAGVLLGLAGPAGAATIHVTSKDDLVANDGVCSLREAVSAANTDQASGAMSGECPHGDLDSVGPDTIDLDSGTYTLTRDADTSTRETANVEDDLNVSSDMRIQGQGPSSTTIEVQGDFRAIRIRYADPLNVPPVGPSVAIDGLTITGGHATVADFWGGGLLDEFGDLKLSDCAFVGNRGDAGTAGTAGTPNGGEGASGGALVYAGTGPLVIDGCRFEDNHAGAGGAGYAPSGSGPGGNGGTGGSGGAIRIHSTEPQTITNTTFLDNSAGPGGSGGDAGPGASGAGGNAGTGGDGGAIYSSLNFQNLQFSDSSFVGNAAGTGGVGGAASAAGGKNGNGGTGGTAGVIRIIGGFAGTRVRFANNSAGDGGAGGDGPGATNSSNGGAGGSSGVYTGITGAFSLTDSTVSGNSAGDGAAGFGLGGGTPGAGGSSGALALGNTSATISGTTFDGNSAGDGGPNLTSNPFITGGSGGAITWTGTGALTLLNSTLTDNRGGRGSDHVFSVPSGGGAGGRGGAILASGGADSTVTATHVTIAGNRSGKTGGDNHPSASVPAKDTPGGAIAGSTAVALTSSVLASNGPFACSGTVSAGDSETIAFEPVSPSCPGRNVDPLLGALANNGGQTQTIAVGAGSPAIDIAPAATCPATDQRGVTRPQGAACDAGAFEREYTPPTPGPGPTPDPTPEPTPIPDTTKPLVVLALLHPHLKTVLAKGYSTAFTSNETGASVVELLVSGKRVGRASKKLTTTGRQKVVVKLTSKARKRYKRAKKLQLTVRVSVTDAAGNQTVKRKTLTLKR